MICATISIYAQQRKRFTHEEFCQKQREFITENARLTPEEAKEFFPLFFELQQNKWKINNEARKKVKKERGQKLTDEECKELVNEFSDAKIKIAKLEKSYIEKYLKVISARKILDVQRAEDRFQKEMIKHMAHGPKKERPNTKD